MSGMPSAKASLEKEVFIFPIYKYGNKKYIPMLYALPLAYIIPTLLIVLMSPLSYNNALLFQLEYILIALFYGLLGILTRSKLRSLLNIIPAALSYITVEFILQGLLNFNPPLNDPYGAFNIASKPIEVALAGFNITGASQIAGVVFIVDLIFIFLIAEIGGFFTAVLSTGFWNPRGEFSAIAVIAKIIAIPFVLIFIIVLPLTLHGVSALVDGGSYIGAGTSELSQAFGMSSGATAAQTVNLANLNIQALKDHALKAGHYFSLANDKLAQLKGNLIVQAVIATITSQYPNLKGFENITNALDLVGSVSEISYVLPQLYLGFISLEKGFNQTLPIIISNDLNYNPVFAKGLTQLSYAFANFSQAWNGVKDSHGHLHSLQLALEQANSLQNVQALQNYVNLGQFFSALNSTVSDLITIRNSFVQFMNGTYEITIAMANMANNNFVKANYWMDAGIQDFIASNATLSKVPFNIAPVQFSLYPKGDGGASGNVQTVDVPIAGVINIAKDLNNLLIRFAYGGLAGVNIFDKMDNVMTSMGSLNYNNTPQTANPTYWNNLATNITDINVYYHYGVANLSEASTLAHVDSQKSYGSLLDSVFTQGSNSFFATLTKQVDTLKANFTDYGHVLDAFANTTLAMRDFSYGSNNLNIAIGMINAGQNGTAQYNTTLANAIGNFTNSQNEAKAGYDALGLTHSLAPAVVTNWQNTLYISTNLGTINNKSLYGADALGILTAGSLSASTDILPMLNLVNSLGLGNILGSNTI